jgi:hypothetical protein
VLSTGRGKLKRLRKALSERGLVRYAYFGGFAAGAGAVALFLYGYVLAGVLAVVCAAALLWLVGVPLLLIPEVAHARRVRRVINDWHYLMHRVVAAAERRWEPLVTSLAALRPPPAIAARHDEALGLLRNRPGQSAGAATIAAYSVRARIALRTLIDDALALPAGTPDGATYARDLRRLWTNAEAASDRDHAQLEVQCDSALRRMRRLRPPASMADDHARLIELMERHCAAMRQRTVAMADADGATVQAANAKLETTRAEWSQVIAPWYEEERARWYGRE